MEKKLNTLERGDTFTLAGINWLVLGVNPKAYPNSNDHYLVEATDDLFRAAFDEGGNNNWSTSSLRARLNGPFLEELVEKCPALSDAIIPLYRDLTADDGLKDYGSCLDKVTMLTDEEYRQTRDLHPAPENWRWLITPDSTPSGGGSAFARVVSSDGSLSSYGAYVGNWGVRPALLLNPKILVSVPDGEDESAEVEGDLTPEQKEMALYEAAVEKFGAGAQILMAVEEMSELQKALLKYLRYKDFNQGDKETVLQNINEERADVEIMLNQLHVIFGDNTEAEAEKLEHLAELVG